MVRFKIDVIQALKDAGYTTYQATRNWYINPNVMNDIRKGKCNISVETLNRICNLLQMQPGEILEWVPVGEELEKAGEVKSAKKRKEPGA